MTSVKIRSPDCHTDIFAIEVTDLDVQFLEKKKKKKKKTVLKEEWGNVKHAVVINH